ncbi:hypothetical protein BDA96_02G440800 [Sorghum bicolor]|uniref:Uncharacterized protein n=1 Tax=Sorghum bicolor TaxID=4558 RepID=A0A921RTL5_SORBI|nr:hypothetical protein BDA96_02G440800 [Sorghum bicolor]
MSRYFFRSILISRSWGRSQADASPLPPSHGSGRTPFVRRMSPASPPPRTLLVSSPSPPHPHSSSSQLVAIAVLKP